MDPATMDASGVPKAPMAKPPQNNQPATARMLRSVSGTLRSSREDQSGSNGSLKKELLPPAPLATSQSQPPAQTRQAPPPPTTTTQTGAAAGAPGGPPAATGPSAQGGEKKQQQFHRRQIGDWKFIRTIGAGSMGKVKMAYHPKQKEICAVKIIPRAAKLHQRSHVNDPPPASPQEAAQRQKEFEKELARDKRTVREGALGRLLFHPYICRLYEMVPMTNHYYMLFEYVQGGQMLDYIVAHGSLKEKHARKFARGIASALEYCHRNNVVHRDLKIENIMINEKGDIKIIDFGLSNLYTPHSLLKTYCGSLYFAAPELLSARPYVGPEVDVWSFGVVLYVLTCGKVPFDDQSVSVLHEKIKKGNVEYPFYVSQECVSLLSRMLVVDPQKRATLHEVINHPWMNKGYDNPVQSYLPKRQPLTLPLDPEIIKTIASYDLGSVQSITDELTKVLRSVEYQMSCENWYKITESGREYASAPNAHMLPDPTGGFHPLISIYFLVDEMRKRRSAKEEALKKRQESDPTQPSTPQLQAEPSISTPPSEITQQKSRPPKVLVDRDPSETHPVVVPVPDPVVTRSSSEVPRKSVDTTPMANTSVVPPVVVAPIPSPLQQIQAQEAATVVTATPAPASASAPSSSLTPIKRNPNRNTAIVGNSPDPNGAAASMEINVLTSPGRGTQPVSTTMEVPSGLHNTDASRPFSPNMEDMFKSLETNPNIQPLKLPEPTHSTQPESDVGAGATSQPTIVTPAPPVGLGLKSPMAEPVARFGQPSTPLPPPVDQVPSHVSVSPDTAKSSGGINNLLRRLSSKRTGQKSPPPQLVISPESPRNDPLVRRGVSMKVTAKEKTSADGQKRTASSSHKKTHGRSHSSKGFHGFTPMEYMPPLPNISTTSTNSSTHTNQSSTSPVSGTAPTHLTPSVSMRRKFHPTARAKSVGHVRKQSYGTPSGGMPPLPSNMAGQNSDDNFADIFDDINLNDVNQLPPLEVPPLTDDEIMEQFRHARPGSMPSIEHSKTMFLKGFFSVQTTSTKPLPVIRCNIIRVLSKLGVRFQEVKGGFICSHTPSYQASDAPPNADDYTSEERRLYGDAFKSTSSSIDYAPGSATPETKSVSRQSSLKHMLSPNDVPMLSHRSSGSMSGAPGHRRMVSSGYRTRDRNGSVHNPPSTPAMAKTMRAFADDVDLNDDSGDFRAHVLQQHPGVEDSVDSVNGLHVQGGSDMLVSSRIEQRARHQHSSSVSSTGGPSKPVKRTPVNFQIEIVKVPIVNLHALILKKIVGNTWNYKHLADRIIGDLNL